MVDEDAAMNRPGEPTMRRQEPELGKETPSIGLVDRIEAGGELLRVARTVDPRFELGALLKQAEARRKAILFESVKGSDVPVAGGLLTSPARFALALNKPNPAKFTQADHVQLVAEAITVETRIGIRGVFPPGELPLA